MASDIDNLSPRYLHTAFDSRIRCRYLLLTLSASNFLRLVAQAYDAGGGLDGQREAIRTTTGVRIRRRLVEDIKAGAIIPPVVLGAIGTQHEIAQEEWSDESIDTLLKRVAADISIIDGVQRTTALREGANGTIDTPVRVELWLAPTTETLIYRMLVLNTGQIPWNLRRQLEVIHRSLITEIQSALRGTLTIFRIDDGRRRTAPAEYQANDVIEMYLAYQLRKPHVDKESVLSDQFSKLDLVEAVSHQNNLGMFVEALSLLALLDTSFSTRTSGNVSVKAKFATGRHIFDKTSACAGFMAAYAQVVMGKVGMDRDPAQQQRKKDLAKSNCEAIASVVSTLDVQAAIGFLALDTLTEVSEKKAGSLSIGEQERELFLSAFRLVFEEGSDLNSMEPAWRSQ